MMHIAFFLLFYEAKRLKTSLIQRVLCQPWFTSLLYLQLDLPGTLYRQSQRGGEAGCEEGCTTHKRQMVREVNEN